MVVAQQDAHVLVEHEHVFQGQHDDFEDVLGGFDLGQFLAVHGAHRAEEFRGGKPVEDADVGDRHFSLVDQRQTGSGSLSELAKHLLC